MRGEFHHVREGQLGEQFGHFGADHGCAEQLAVFFIHNDLHKAAVIAQAERLAVCLEREAADLDIVVRVPLPALRSFQTMRSAAGNTWRAASFHNRE